MSDYINIEKSCAFTGHRDIVEYPSLQGFTALLCDIIEGGVDTFLCGMARGFDTFAAEAVLRLKGGGKNIKLIACVPCPEQDKFFSKEDRQKYNYILSRADEVKIISDNYFKGCMQMRDRFMVDNSSCIVAYLREQTGGTAYTVNYAQKKNKKIYRV